MNDTKNDPCFSKNSIELIIHNLTLSNSIRNNIFKIYHEINIRIQMHFQKTQFKFIIQLKRKTIKFKLKY